MRLRPARLSDAPALAALHVQSWRETYPGIISEDFLKNLSVESREAMWRKYLAPEYQGPRFNIVAEDAGRGLIGFGSGGPQRDALSQPQRFDSELWAIYLLKEFQGQGIGKALFQGVTGQLKALGSASMLVWVLQANPACGFYKKMGGTLLGSKQIMIDRQHQELAYGWQAI